MFALTIKAEFKTNRAHVADKTLLFVTSSTQSSR